MGGKLIDNCSRLKLIDQNKVKQEISNILKSLNINFFTPYELKDKESFGDLDVVIDYSLDIKSVIDCNFNPTQIKVNGHVTSFGWKVMNLDVIFQIDFIFCESKLMKMFEFYLSQGDLGHILGRLFNSYGIKFGMNGLWVKIGLDEDPTTEKTDLILTVDPKCICEFIDIDFQRWVEGFNTADEMFEWICTSPLFRVNKFGKSEFNCLHRQRMSKRGTQDKFLDYLDNNQNTDKEQENSWQDNLNLKKRSIIQFNKWDEEREMLEQIHLVQESKKKLNAKIISEVLNLDLTQKENGKKVGDFLYQLRKNFGEDQHSKIVQIEDINRFILMKYEIQRECL